jgi:histone-lysine N-methyltransferase SUV420H
LKTEKFFESTIDQEPGHLLDACKAETVTVKTQTEPENHSIHISSQSFADVVSLSHPSPVSSMDHSRRGSISTATGDGQTSTDATSVDDDTIIVKQPTYLTPTIPAAKRIRGGKVTSALEQAKTTEAIIIGASTTFQHPAIELVGSAPESILSELDNAEMNVLEQSLEVAAAVPPKKTRGRPKRKRMHEEDEIEDSETSNKKKRRRCSSSPTPEASITIRTPGDYVLTPALLAQPASAWINCSKCEDPFVQEDAYFTRSSCPRCERHSKLYGYMWPKTDKESRDDSEERVLDHRTVHRFIRPEEERSIRKKNNNVMGSRTTSIAITREASEPLVQNQEDEVAPPVVVKRGRGRPRKTM